VTKAAKLPAELNKELIGISKKIFKILMLSGYARLDFRLTPDNNFYFIEANANPYLAKDEDFAQSALHYGISYKNLLKKIINTGLNN
jgi:D-alanine-D-alanine ligase